MCTIDRSHPNYPFTEPGSEPCTWCGNPTDDQGGREVAAMHRPDRVVYTNLCADCAIHHTAGILLHCLECGELYDVDDREDEVARGYCSIDCSCDHALTVAERNRRILADQDTDLEPYSEHDPRWDYCGVEV